MSAPVQIVVGLEGASAVASALEGVAARLASLGAVAMAVNKAFNGVASAIGLGGKLTDLSARTGETTENLVILRRAFEAAGISAESVGQATGLLQRSLAGVNDDGTSTAVTFAQLGLSMGRLRSMNTLEQLQAIGQALQKLPTPADRAAAAMRILGRSGTELLPLLLDGGAFSQARKDVGELADEMQRSATGFDRVGDKAEAFKRHVEAGYTVVASRLLPSIERLVDLMNSVSAYTMANGMQRAVELGLFTGGTLALGKLLPLISSGLINTIVAVNGSISTQLGRTISGFTGGLAKALPWGLAAAVAVEIGIGLYQASWDAKNHTGQLRAEAQEEAEANVRKLSEIRSQADADVLAKENAGRLATLEKRKKELDALRDKEVWKASPAGISAGGMPTASKRGLSGNEAADLALIEEKIAAAHRFNADLQNTAKLQADIAKNTAADREAEAKQQATAKAKREIFDLETQLQAAKVAENQPEIDRLNRLLAEKKLQEDLRDIADKGVATADLKARRMEAYDAALAKERADASAAFDLATQQQAAELQANLAEQNRLTLLANEKKYRDELRQKGVVDEAQVQAWLKADKELLNRQAAKVGLTAQLTAAEGALQRIEQARGNITQNQLLDETTKLKRLTSNTEDYRTELAKVVELKERELALAVGAEEQARLQAEIAALKAGGTTYGAADLPSSKYEATATAFDSRGAPSKSYQSAGQGMAGGALQFVTGLGTAADNVASVVEGTLNSALQGTSDMLYDLITTSASFGEIWSKVTLQIGQQFLRMCVDMVAKMIWRNTVERALIALGVTTHVAGEGAKTVATTTGGGIRLLTVAKEALAAVYHGAVSAFSAMASIPYVGPILGAAAMAAALAGGIALVSKIAKRATGGPVWQGQPVIVGDGGRPEVFVPHSDGYIVPSLQAYAGLADTAAGNLAARGAQVGGISNAAQVARNGASTTAAETEAEPMRVDFGIMPLDTHAMMQQWAETRRGRAYLINMMRGVAEQVR